MSPATKTQIRQVISLAIVVLVIVGIIYTVAGGRYSKAEFVARFLFNRTPDIKEKPVEVVDMRALLQTTPKLMAEGKQVFELNCVPCHGSEGYGNGPRSAGLNPPPRDFHQPKFRYGTDLLTLFHTVTNGSPGTAMPSFAGVLTAEQRMAAVHYVQHWIPGPKAVTAAQIAALPQPTAAASGPTPLPPLKAVAQGPRIPIDLAMKLTAKPGPPPDPPAPAVADNALGAAIYGRDCARCHAADGGGRLPIQMLTPYYPGPERAATPTVEVEAEPFERPLIGGWLGNPANFAKLVAHGLPGRMMPGYGTLTQAEMAALYAHVEHLASARAGAGAATTQAAVPPGGSQ